MNKAPVSDRAMEWWLMNKHHDNRGLRVMGVLSGSLTLAIAGADYNRVMEILGR